MRKILLIGGLLALALAGCGQSSPAAPAPSAQPTAQSTAIAAPSAAPPGATAGAYPAPVDSDQATAAAYPAPSDTTSIRPSYALVEAATDKLGPHIRGGQAADVRLLQSAHYKDWPDGSLGCPQAGMTYPQVVTPGFLLVFEAGSQTYEVHTGMSEQQLILCQDKQPVDLNRTMPQPQLPTPTTVPSAGPADIARQALADALGIKVADVTVVVSAEAVWNDSSLGCPKPGLNYMQVITPGYTFTLEAGGKRYEYHTDRGHTVVRCDKG